jgi:hypothetical protein
MRASLADFLPDEALSFRSIGSAPITASFFSQPISLAKLEAFWTTDEWGIADKLEVMINVSDITFDDDETYSLRLEVDSSPTFASPVVVAQMSFADDAPVGHFVTLTVDPDDMVEFDQTAKFIRLVAELNGAAPQLSFSAYVRK